MHCKNEKCKNQLTTKQAQFCSKSCHYEWKRNQPSKISQARERKRILKQQAASLENKNDIYDFISKNIFKFKTHFLGTERATILKMVNEHQLNIDMRNIYSWEDLYNYFNEQKTCHNKNCSSPSKFNSFTTGYHLFCSDKCLHEWRSYNMEGENNNFHKVSPESRIILGEKISARIKDSIKNGTFTPNVTNSWARSKCTVDIIRNKNKIKINLRSSWEAYFQLHNPNFKYEKLRIPYFYKESWHNYIVDFIDDESKTIYEIKPLVNSDSTLNSIKREAAIKWALVNEYQYVEINDEWFYSNYSESMLNGQPEEKRLKRLLSQFNENKKN